MPTTAAAASVVASAVTNLTLGKPTRRFLLLTRSVAIRHKFHPQQITVRKMSTSPTAAAAGASSTDAAAPAPIVQYVVLRRDLGEDKVVCR